MEPKEASFLPMEEKLMNADLSHVNTILGIFGLKLMFIRKGSLIFHFCINKNIDEELFMEALSRIIPDLFQQNISFLGRIKVLEMKIAPPGIQSYLVLTVNAYMNIHIKIYWLTLKVLLFVACNLASHH